jgi:hypothetical protein
MGLHDLTTRAVRYENEVTVAVLVLAVLAFAVLSRVDGRTWWAIRRQRDRTRVGRTLKGKKLAYAWFEAMLALLYLLTLLDELDWFAVGIWWRLGIRLVTITAVIVAAVVGEQFYRAYEAQNWGQPETAAAQRARGIAQDATDVRQRARDVAQDARDDRWGAR